jgi:hypothetical protein
MTNAANPESSLLAIFLNLFAPPMETPVGEITRRMKALHRVKLKTLAPRSR